jgi:beta-glucanase (GH16 family)
MRRDARAQGRVARESRSRIDAIGICLLLLVAAAMGVLRWTVWDDEEPGTVVLLDETFDGPAGAPPDPARWYRYNYCDGWDLVLSCNVPGNATLDGKGNLVLRARGVPNGVRDAFGNQEMYSAARVTTRTAGGRNLFTFRHGTASAWIKTASPLGSWSAFWLLNERDPRGRYGEQDPLESLGHEGRDGLYHVNVHNWTHSTDDARSDETCQVGVDLTQGFHKYTTVWKAGKVSFYFDDRLCVTHRASDLPHWYLDTGPAFLLLSLSVGAWGRPPQRVAGFSATMKVSRVLVTG